jgi:hypothetical protein
LFALELQATEGIPGQWVEPVEGGDEPGGELEEKVESLDVRQFMTQDGPAGRFGPGAGDFGKQDHGAEEAPGQWDEGMWGLAELDP